ncbi:MAG: hypothetical protein IJ157_06970 [Clostridia bacterium]|nr:hypothetical protein [Clostridia bacterium]
MKLRVLLPLAVLLCILTAACRAEIAWVQTPGGALNMRKTQSAKATVVANVPNHSQVEADEVGETWTKITYKKKSGYVKTEYLLLSSSLAGRTGYPGAEGLIAYAAPDADAAVAAVFNSDEALYVESVEGEWAAVSREGRWGYAPVADIAALRQEPADMLGFIPQSGVTAQDCEAKLTDVQTVSLPAGTALTVGPLKGGRCLAETPQGWVWLDCAAISLEEYPDQAVSLMGGLTSGEAVSKAEAALKKAYKAYGKQRMYAVPTLHREEAYRCGFFNDEGKLLYCAVIGENGNVMALADYTAFAAPVRAAQLLPYGEIMLELSQDTLAAGDVLDIAVSAWTERQCQYALEGPVTVETAPGPHFAAAWRPRVPGEYTLTVTVTDEDGHSAAGSRVITVTPSGEETLDEIYSQKDGWWLDVPYRDSSLDKSGCAIFTLSHALSRMGLTGSDLLPRSLAKTFALCLTPDGTNNERLIREAAAAYGFSTKSGLINDAKQIASYLRNGSMFSFSIARGHIALAIGVSEDGTMVRVVDSAPHATFERIVNDSLYYMTRSGGFRAAVRLEDIPGARWYLDTDDYGGLEYWLRLSYVAKRGARLIQPAE